MCGAMHASRRSSAMPTYYCRSSSRPTYSSDSTLNGAKHTSSGDETPPIPEEELEQQKIEHERQMQKEKECQAREAEEVRKLDIELLHQRAIEAEEEQKREMIRGLVPISDSGSIWRPSEIAVAVEELRGMNTSWSHHRLCDLQRQAARLRHSRPSIPDTTKHYRSVLKKACSAQLAKPQSSQSISESDGIFINLTRLRSCRDESLNSDGCCESGCTGGAVEGTEVEGAGDDGVENLEAAWRSSANDVIGHRRLDLVRTPSCPGSAAISYASYNILLSLPSVNKINFDLYCCCREKSSAQRRILLQRVW